LTKASPDTPAGALNIERVLELVYVLEKIYEYKIAPRGEININRDILRHVVESCSLDMARMQAFHSIAVPDRHKRAAFLMVWIVRMRPIQLNAGVSVTEGLLLINEIFAVHAGFAALSIPGDICSVGYLRNLVYILHYRNLTPEILASSMYLLERACLGKNP